MVISALSTSCGQQHSIFWLPSPVRMARSCRFDFLFSPKPGALTATTFTPARSLFTMSVARAWNKQQHSSVQGSKTCSSATAAGSNNKKDPLPDLLGIFRQQHQGLACYCFCACWLPVGPDMPSISTGTTTHLTLNVLCHNHQGPLDLHYLLQHWQDGSKPVAKQDQKTKKQCMRSVFGCFTPGPKQLIIVVAALRDC